MTSWLPERRIHCPYCGESITIVVDTSADSQSYVEDCQVCCQPIEITIEAANGELLFVGVDR